MADVNLFGDRGGAARGGGVGRPARGDARNRVPQTRSPTSCGLFRGW